MVSREKYVFLFEEGRKENKALLGGKGANLAEMALIGLPIPPGFTISTRACNYYLSGKKKFPPSLKREIEQALSAVESKTGKRFGDKKNPLLVSVRSGAPVSMPGMMDTILNLGLNDCTLEGLIIQSGNKRFALDSYRRLIQMFGNVVTGIPEEKFEEILSEAKKKRNAKSDVDLQEEDLEKIIEKFKTLYRVHAKKPFPQDPKKQLFLAISAVFDSWNTKRAITYRKIHKIPDSIGTAANVQAMVFGNMGNDSGTGVAFTRNPSTGENKFYGEYLVNSQGEDVVAGIRTP
ncbi:MAG: PEP/pyruvate-binding domain-containing protein, partial [Candidatus Diapherotrites archaeon]